MYPILATLGSFEIYSFGVFILLGFLAGSFYIWREGKNEFHQEQLFDTVLVVTVSALLGARLLYIFTHFTDFYFNPLRWLHFYLYPGFSFWGSFFGGIAGTIWYTKKIKVSFWRMADFLVLGAGLGQIFAQVGCFLNGCTVGKPSSLPWAMATLGFLEKRHPVAAYDTLAAMIVFLILLRVSRWIFAHRRQREGTCGLTFITLAAAFSFPLEFLKEGGVYFYGLDLNQWIALFVFTAGGGLFYSHLRNIKGDISLTIKFFQHKVLFKKDKDQK